VILYLLRAGLSQCDFFFFFIIIIIMGAFLHSIWFVNEGVCYLICYLIVFRLLGSIL
jgi:hypothetical protein